MGPVRIPEVEEGIPSYLIAGRNGVMVGDSAAIREVQHQLERVANFDVPVLLLGETGTGKELAAKSLHYNGRRGRNNRPFVVANCPTLTQGLEESILFGHEKGAFTGADRSRLGLVRQSNEGTLLLDELTWLQPPVQAKLLRLLQEGEVLPLGSDKGTHVDVRIISATNKNLYQEVQEGRFQEDLFYRLSTVPINIPPLRARKEDLPHLIRHFLRLYSNKFSASIAGVSDEAMEKLYRHDWPGNVRELQNVLQRAIVYRGKGSLREEDVVFDSEIHSYKTTVPVSASEVLLQPSSTNGANGKHAVDKVEAPAKKWYARGVYPVPAVELSRISGIGKQTLDNIVAGASDEVYSLLFGGDKRQSRFVYVTPDVLPLFEPYCEPQAFETLKGLVEDNPWKEMCSKPHRIFTVSDLLEEPETTKSQPGVTELLRQNPDLVIYQSRVRIYFAVPVDRAPLFVRRGEGYEGRVVSFKDSIARYHAAHFEAFQPTNGNGEH